MLNTFAVPGRGGARGLPRSGAVGEVQLPGVEAGEGGRDARQAGAERQVQAVPQVHAQPRARQDDLRRLLKK